jgi:hypothetical protein
MDKIDKGEKLKKIDLSNKIKLSKILENNVSSKTINKIYEEKVYINP